MSDDDPSTTLPLIDDRIDETVDNMESVTEPATVSMDDTRPDDTQPDDTHPDEPPQKKRKSVKRQSDGYTSRKRSKSSKSVKTVKVATASDEYEVEMIIDHKTDEKVKKKVVLLC